MGATYEIVFRRPTGQFVSSANIRDFLSLDYTLRANTVGQFSVTLPADRYPASMFGEDYRIEIWRKPRGGTNYLEGETCWFLTHLEPTNRLTNIHGISANGLLQRKVVAYQDEIQETYVKKFGRLDNMLKDAVRENTGVVPTFSHNHGIPDLRRYWTPYFTVQANTNNWPPNDLSIGRRITHNTLYDVAQKNADKATHYTPGVFYFFDIVQIANDGVTNPFLELRTYVGQRGSDRRGFVVFSEDEKTLTNAKLFLDWGDSYNRIYAGGPGSKSARVFGTADETDIDAHLAINPFALREKFLNAKKSKDAGETQEYAIENLNNKENQPYRQLQATLTEGACHRYGVDFFFGDRVTAQFLDQSFDTFINPVHVHIENGHEEYEIQITEKINLYASGLVSEIRKTNQIKRRLEELETIDSWA